MALTPGATHSVSGSGELTLTAPAIGLLVTLSNPPTGASETFSDPPAYFDVGLISAGTALGWFAHERVTILQEIFVFPTPATRVGYTFPAPSSAVLTELTGTVSNQAQLLLGQNGLSWDQFDSLGVTF